MQKLRGKVAPCLSAFKQQAPVVFLALSGKARDVVLEIDPAELNDDKGMDEVYKKLDKLFLVDENQQALTDYGNFEKYARPKWWPSSKSIR